MADLLAKWLRGCTCDSRRGHKVLWEDETFAVLKHAGHREWTGRFSGNGYCETVFVLCRKSDLLAYRANIGNSFVNREPELKRWHGRWTKAKFDEAMALCQAGRAQAVIA